MIFDILSGILSILFGTLCSFFFLRLLFGFVITKIKTYLNNKQKRNAEEKNTANTPLIKRIKTTLQHVTPIEILTAPFLLAWFLIQILLCLSMISCFAFLAWGLGPNLILVGISMLRDVEPFDLNFTFLTLSLLATLVTIVLIVVNRKKPNKNWRKTAAVVSGALAVIALYLTAPFNPSPEPRKKEYSIVSPTGGDGSGFDAGLRDAPLTQEITGSLDRVVYLSPSGNSYHFSCSCPSLSNCEYLREMKLREAYYDYNVKDPCNICAGGS